MSRRNTKESKVLPEPKKYSSTNKARNSFRSGALASSPKERTEHFQAQEFAIRDQFVKKHPELADYQWFVADSTYDDYTAITEDDLKHIIVLDPVIPDNVDHLLLWLSIPYVLTRAGLLEAIIGRQLGVEVHKSEDLINLVDEIDIKQPIVIVARDDESQLSDEFRMTTYELIRIRLLGFLCEHESLLITDDGYVLPFTPEIMSEMTRHRNEITSKKSRRAERAWEKFIAEHGRHDPEIKQVVEYLRFLPEGPVRNSFNLFNISRSRGTSDPSVWILQVLPLVKSLYFEVNSDEQNPLFEHSRVEPRFALLSIDGKSFYFNEYYLRAHCELIDTYLSTTYGSGNKTQYQTDFEDDVLEAFNLAIHELAIPYIDSHELVQHYQLVSFLRCRTPYYGKVLNRILIQKILLTEFSKDRLKDIKSGDYTCQPDSFRKQLNRILEIGFMKNRSVDHNNFHPNRYQKEIDELASDSDLDNSSDEYD
jgi:hypothetical protein